MRLSLFGTQIGSRLFALEIFNTELSQVVSSRENICTVFHERYMLSKCTAESVSILIRLLNEKTVLLLTFMPNFLKIHTFIFIPWPEFTVA